MVDEIITGQKSFIRAALSSRSMPDGSATLAARRPIERMVRTSPTSSPIARRAPSVILFIDDRRARPARAMYSLRLTIVDLQSLPRCDGLFMFRPFRSPTRLGALEACQEDFRRTNHSRRRPGRGKHWAIIWKVFWQADRPDGPSRSVETVKNPTFRDHDHSGTPAPEYSTGYEIPPSQLRRVPCSPNSSPPGDRPTTSPRSAARCDTKPSSWSGVAR